MQQQDKRYTRHPVSEVFGDMGYEEWQDFVADIRANGIRDTIIWLHDDQVLDGWHRYLAHVGLTREGYDLPVLTFNTWQGADPVGYAISKNLHRRQLNPSQRAAVVARLHGMDRAVAGGQPGNRNAAEDGDGARAADAPATVADMAQQAGVGTSTMRDALVAQEAGKGDEVIAGDVSAHAAAEEVREQGRREREIEQLRADLTAKEQQVAELREALAAAEREADDIRWRLMIAGRPEEEQDAGMADAPPGPGWEELAPEPLPPAPAPVDGPPARRWALPDDHQSFMTPNRLASWRRESIRNIEEIIAKQGVSHFDADRAHTYMTTMEVRHGELMAALGTADVDAWVAADKGSYGMSLATVCDWITDVLPEDA